MAKIRLQCRYWAMIHQAIELAITEKEKQIEKILLEIVKLPIKADVDKSLELRCYEKKEKLETYYVLRTKRPNARVMRKYTLAEIQEMRSKVRSQYEKIADIREDIKRYEAIDLIVQRAVNKKDSILDGDGIGPDYEPPEEMTPEEEFKWRTMDSIGY